MATGTAAANLKTHGLILRGNRLTSPPPVLLGCVRPRFLTMSNEVVEAMSQHFLENCLTVSAQVLCCYDFLLTFTRDVRFMWKLKPSVGSVLFFALRYSAPFNTIAVVFGYLFQGSWQSQLSCTIMARLQMVGDVLILTCAAIFTALRIYALSGNSKWRLGFMLVLGLLNPVISTYTFVLSTPYLAHITPQFQTCNINTQVFGYRWMMAGRASAVVFDAIALLLTWLRIKHMVGASRRTDGSGMNRRSMSGMGNMSVVLMSDSATYFGFLTVINAAGIAFRRFLEAASTWSAVMTSILLSRLILDLHQASSEDYEGGTYFSRALTTMLFKQPPGTSEEFMGHELELPVEDEDDSAAMHV
ncbi:uncharacterized protein B0H18DRAFT_935260 [Fomitopsis serialis]|uniref:uncharacterized protein n=1 Tax=Fomitopsis serialis TaxID=139415 RepID=UPI002008CEA1|nr:uncharacterized protein B0H18DRAFT_944022 [Neoantrodia serialis]XP_047891369.1 uncharacterized protein B0H18DRAFT_935260 [Neoantrodia serialis]KAH9911715.1 hypothetical protein B0H18DRAFT_944022 [Neoantrodia serialis]KAH9922455.1 hypothetical protein B0H18DRAFT_935260 [Neoantrodia serialis]